MANGPDYWAGQQKINGELCRVDWKLIEALKAVSNALAQVAAARNADGTQLVVLDLAALDKLIADADGIGEVVADIIPPGCDPHDRRS